MGESVCGAALDLARGVLRVRVRVLSVFDVVLVLVLVESVYGSSLEPSRGVLRVRVRVVGEHWVRALPGSALELSRVSTESGYMSCPYSTSQLLITCQVI